MIAHANAKHAGNPIKYYCSDKRGPAPKKESTDRQHVTNNKKNCRAPIEPLRRRPRFFTRCRHVQMFPTPKAIAERCSSAPAIALIFFNSVRWKPKKVAIWTIWFRLTKSAGLEQNFCIPGSNSRQLMPFGILMPSRQSPSAVKLTQKSQTIIFLSFLRYRVTGRVATISGKAFDSVRFGVVKLKDSKQIRRLHQLTYIGRQVEQLELATAVLY